MYVDNLKHWKEYLKNKTKHTENIGDLDNKERCLNILTLENNFNFDKKNVFQHYLLSCTHSTWSMKTLSQATLTYLHFSIPTPTTVTDRSTNTLNHPKNQSILTPYPLINPSQGIHQKGKKSKPTTVSQ